MTHQKDLLKIGEFARLSDTNLRTLRYYEELGLLHPAARSEGGFRYYRPEDANRLRWIRQLQDLGLSLERIGEILPQRDRVDQRPEFMAAVEAALTEQERLIVSRIAELEARRTGIAAARAKLLHCQLCDQLPAAVNNHCSPCAHTREELPEDLAALF